jgi:uncharacterized protein (TIGR01777 family)
MKILIAGGSGFLGNALTASLETNGHDIFILTRRQSTNSRQIHWDGRTTIGWSHIINEVDAVINLTGFGLEHWPWTQRQKERFINSRVLPGLALATAIKESTRRPGIFIQQSGINHYGLRGASIADESTSPANDFLAQLTVKWEAATQPVEELGLRRIVARTAVVLGKHSGLFPLMALPVRLFFGGKLGTGQQAMPWIHLDDWVGAMLFLLKSESARGAYNLIAPHPVNNADFMRAVAKTLKRPYWFHIPAFLLKTILGKMNVLIVEGRFVQPKRLIESGYRFQFEVLEDALIDLCG